MTLNSTIYTIHTEQSWRKGQKGKCTTLKKLFLDKYKEEYNALGPSAMAEIDKLAKEYEEAASEIDSEEYSQLQRAQKENPDMKVVLKTKSSHRHKSDYKGLTYDYMTRFIRIMDRENLLTFQDVIAHYEDFGYDSGKVYQYVKDWFLDTYPHHKDMIVDSTPRRITPKAVA